jgi:glutamine synthetase
VRGLKEIYGSEYAKHASEQMELIEKISSYIANINRGVTDMINARKKANSISNNEQRAQLYCNEVLPFFDEIRYHSDRLELLVDDELWSMVKYRELLFLR